MVPGSQDGLSWGWRDSVFLLVFYCEGVEGGYKVFMVVGVLKHVMDSYSAEVQGAGKGYGIGIVSRNRGDGYGYAVVTEGVEDGVGKGEGEGKG